MATLGVKSGIVPPQKILAFIFDNKKFALADEGEIRPYHHKQMAPQWSSTLSKEIDEIDESVMTLARATLQVMLCFERMLCVFE